MVTRVGNTTDKLVLKPNPYLPRDGYKLTPTQKRHLITIREQAAGTRRIVDDTAFVAKLAMRDTVWYLITAKDVYVRIVGMSLNYGNSYSTQDTVTFEKLTGGSVSHISSMTWNSFLRNYANVDTW